MSKSEKSPKEDSGFELNFGGGKLSFGGLFKGLEKLIDLADQVEKVGGEMKKEGEFRVKGMKDLKGIYGFSIRTGLGRNGQVEPIIEPFGNIKKTHQGAVVEDSREPIVDVFDGEDGVQVVAELPGVSEKEIQFSIKGDVLVITTSGERKYNKEILLPDGTVEEGLEKGYRNGVFELKLKKTKKSK